jgi:putative lipoic acid-binding regulatory protein
VATSKESKQLILDDTCKTRPDIDYPTKWSYKIIGRDKEKLLACIKEIMGEKQHSCTIGNVSKNGKFTTYNANCTVETEEERNRIFKYFEDHDDIDMVI